MVVGIEEREIIERWRKKQKEDNGRSIYKEGHRGWRPEATRQGP